MLLLASAVYVIKSTLEIRPSSFSQIVVQGQGASSHAQGATGPYPLQAFRGTRINVGTPFSGQAAVWVKPHPVLNLTDWAVRDLMIAGSGSAQPNGAETGLLVGGVATTQLLGWEQSQVENVATTDFPTGIRISNARLVNFRRCSAWNNLAPSGNGVVIETFQTPAFTGDITFENCQYVAKASGSRGVLIENNKTYVLPNIRTELKGIRFQQCIFYVDTDNEGTRIYASNGGQIGDIWFGGCQWDGAGMKQAIYIEASGNGQTPGLNTIVDNINFNDIYIRGVAFNRPVLSQAITITRTGSGGELGDIHFNGGWVANTSGYVFVVYNTTGGIRISDFSMYGVYNPGLSAIIFSAAESFHVTNSFLRAAAGYSVGAMIRMQPDCSKFNISGNIAQAGTTTGGTVLDLTGAVPKYVAGNL